MTIAATTTATNGYKGAGSAVVGMVAGVGPVGMVVGPVDGGDVVNEIGVGSAVGIPIKQTLFTV